VRTPQTRIDINGTAGQRLNLRVQAHAADLREVDSLAAAPFVFASRAFDLINESAFCFDQQPAYERGFSVIDVAGGREAKNVAAQK